MYFYSKDSIMAKIKSMGYITMARVIVKIDL